MDQWDKKMAEINATLDRIAKRQEEAEKRHAEWQKEAEKRQKEADKRHAKWQKEAEKRQEEADRRQEKADKEWEDLRNSLKETQRILSGVGISNGMVAEELVYRSLQKSMTFCGVVFDRISYPLHQSITLLDGKKIEGEFDVALLNGTSAAIIDVKYRVRKEDIDYLINVQMPKFKTVLPQCRDYKMYLGIGGMAFEKGMEEEALRRGVAVLRLNDNFVEVCDEGVKVW